MKQSTKWIIALCASVLTIGLILAVKYVDVAEWELSHVTIGLSDLNFGFFARFAPNDGWYLVSKLLGLVALALVGVFACYGLYQWIRGRSLSCVDRSLFVLGGLYVVLGILYIFFEKVVINYRPIIEEGATEAEASFPSSHTLLAFVVFGSAWILLPKLFGEEGEMGGAWNGFLRDARIVLIQLMILAVGSRLVSGVHWLTDICGGVLIGTALLAVFGAVLDGMEQADKESGRDYTVDLDRL